MAAGVNFQRWTARVNKIIAQIDREAAAGVAQATNVLFEATSKEWRSLGTTDIGKGGVTLSRQDSSKPRFVKQRNPVRKKVNAKAKHGTVKVQSFLTVVKYTGRSTARRSIIDRAASEVVKIGGEKALRRSSLTISRKIFGSSKRQPAKRFSLRKGWLADWSKPKNLDKKYAIRLSKKYAQARHNLTLGPALKATADQVARIMESNIKKALR